MGAIVPADPAAPWRVVLVTDRARDPAIVSTNAELLVEYLTTRDPALIGREIELDGEPTWYTLAPLSYAAISEIEAREEAPSRRRELACRVALVSISGPGAANIDTSNREPGPGKSTALAAREVEALYRSIGYEGIAELGDIALVRARLRPGRRGPFGLCQS